MLIGQSGKTYSIGYYASDIAAAVINLDGGSGPGTGSPTFWIAPEPCILSDVFIHTGMTDTTNMRLMVNGKPTYHTFRFAALLDTSNARPKFRIGIPNGAQVSFTQLA